MISCMMTKLSCHVVPPCTILNRQNAPYPENRVALENCHYAFDRSNYGQQFVISECKIVNGEKACIISVMNEENDNFYSEYYSEDDYDASDNNQVGKVLGLGEKDPDGNYNLDIVDYDNSPGSNCWIVITQLWEDSCKNGYHEGDRDNGDDCDATGRNVPNDYDTYRRRFNGRCCVKD